MAEDSKLTGEIIEPTEDITTTSISTELNNFLRDDKAVENMKSIFGMFMKRSQTDQWLQLIYKSFVVVGLVGAVVFLSYHEKFTPAVAFAVGTLSGVILASSRD